MTEESYRAGRADLVRVLEAQRALLELRLAERDGDPEPIDPQHLPAVLEGLAQAKRREFATDEEIEAALRRFDR